MHGAGTYTHGAGQVAGPTGGGRYTIDTLGARECTPWPAAGLRPRGRAGV